MRQMIDELKAIPGVVGASMYSANDGLLVTNLPGIFKPERLNAVGKHLTKLYSAGRLSFDDLTDVTLNYDESVVVARELDKQLLVFAFCDPSLNHNLLSMSFNLLQEDYRAGSFSHEVSTSAAVSSPAVPASVPQTVAEPEGALATLLDLMRERLSKILGPMAGFIFSELLEKWQQQGASDFSRIDRLLVALDEEIADQEKIDRYRQLIEPELKAFREG